MTLQTEILADSPRGYWRFNEAPVTYGVEDKDNDSVPETLPTGFAASAADTAFSDSSGNGMHGVHKSYNGTYGYSRARIEYGLVGDGGFSIRHVAPSDTSASCESRIPHLFNNSTFSVEFVGMMANNGYIKVSRNNAFEMYTGTTQDPYGATHSFYCGGELTKYTAPGSGFISGGGTYDDSISYTGWDKVFHAAMTFDGTTVRLYRDGTLVDSFTPGAGGYGGNATYGDSATSYLLVKASQAWIDDLAYYSNTVLTGARIAAHAAEVSAINTARARGVMPGLASDSDMSASGLLQTGTNTRTGPVSGQISAKTTTLAALGQVVESGNALGQQTLALGSVTETYSLGTIDVTFPSVEVTGTGEGTVEAEGDVPVVPNITIQILDPTLLQAPTSLTVVVFGGFPDQPIDFYIDGVKVWTTDLNSEGNLGPVSIGVPEELGAMGVHTLVAQQPGSTYGQATFTLRSDPTPVARVRGPDADPVAVPESIRPNGTQQWVFQDLLPEAQGGIGSYVMPLNPKEMSSPHHFKQMTSKHTTAITGQYHVWEAEALPREWEFSGYCPTQDMHDKMNAYLELNRRFYVIDHRNRAWKVVFTEIDFKAKLYQTFNGEPTIWGHDYVVHALILDQDWTVPQ